MDFTPQEFLNNAPESSLSDFQESGTFRPKCAIIDQYGNKHIWLDDDELSSSQSPPSSISHTEPEFPEQNISQDFRNKKLSKISKSKPLVPKTNQFIFKDDFSSNDSKKLPDVILVSPLKQNTSAPNVNSSFNFEDEKTNLNRNMEVENEMEDYSSLQLFNNEELEYLEGVLPNLEQNIFNFGSNTCEIIDPLDCFNNIPCNINQQDAVVDFNSAIETPSKKSTEILSEIDLSHDSFREHNYFFPEKIVPCVPSTVHVPVPIDDFAIETEVSSTPSTSLNSKTAEIVLSKCTIPATSPSSTSIKPSKCKNRNVAKKVGKKPASYKTDPDPTYKPNTKRPKQAKKSAKHKTIPNQTKLVAPVKKFNTGGIAQIPRIPKKPASITDSKSAESSNTARSQIPATNSAQNKTIPNQTKQIAPVAKFNTCGIAQIPRIPKKPASITDSKSAESSNTARSQIPAANSAQNKTIPNQTKLIAPVAKFNTCGIAQIPGIPKKPASITDSKSAESSNTARSQIPATNSAQNKIIPNQTKLIAPVAKFNTCGIAQIPGIPKKPASITDSKSAESSNTARSQIPAANSAQNKTIPNQTKPIAPVAKFNTCGIAQISQIPEKPASCTEPKLARSQIPAVEVPAASIAKPKSFESDNAVKFRAPAVEKPKAAPQVPTTTTSVGTVPKNKPDSAEFAGLSTPLASPTRDDVLDKDFSNEHFRQPETQCSNVDSTVEPTQQKKISFRQYLQKRANYLVSIETISTPPISNIEEILRAIVKPKPLHIDEVLPTITKSQPKPMVKTEPVDTVPKKLVIKSESASNYKTSAPVVKSEPIPKPANPSKNCEPIRRLAEANAKKPIIKPPQNPIAIPPQNPIAKPPQNPITISKPLKEPENSAPLKLIKVAIPEKVRSARSFSISPNEISRSIDSCDRCSSSGVSSYQSVSSLCGSPFVPDDKSNDTKYFNREKIATSKQQQSEKKVLQIPFAVNKELLRKEDRSSSKHKYRRDQRHRNDSRTHKRKHSDSCFEDDSDSSDYSDRKRSRRRYVSTSSSSSDKSYHHRSRNTEYSSSHQTHHTHHRYGNWDYPTAETAPESYLYSYNEVPSVYYAPSPHTSWPPDFGVFYYPFTVSKMELPHHFRGYQARVMDMAADSAIERRALFVGNIEDTVTEKDLRKRFERFGRIESVKICHRGSSNCFGFVYYSEEKYVQKAIQHGNDDPNLPRYKLSVGVRKERCADRRAFTYDKPIPMANLQAFGYQEPKDTFEVELRQLKKDINQHTLSSRHK